jgi:argininosuccinate lyase
MQKLWHEDQKIDELIEAFMTGDDLSLDQKLVPYDVLGSLAHAQVLNHLEIITKNELEQLQTGLVGIYQDWKKGQFVLQFGDEDVHTKIELSLTKSLGEIGKKLHTGRSRNDQVLTALRVWEKEQLLSIAVDVSNLIHAFLLQAVRFQDLPLVGFTHTQPAMPSSVGLWLASYADGLIDALIHLSTMLALIDQSPLGTAAGYGVALNLDRELAAKLLGFGKIQLTAPYAQQSRITLAIQTQATLLHTLLHLNTFATDVIFFASESLKYLNVDSELCTGSSIMPHKKNVDVAELLRAQYHVVLGTFVETASLKTGLISGYHRDFQLSKKALIESVETVQKAIKVGTLLVNGLQPNEEVLQTSITNDLYSVNAILQAVDHGVPFRAAYHEWQQHLNAYLQQPPESKTITASVGSAENIPFKQLKSKLAEVETTIRHQQEQFQIACTNLLALKGTYA